MEQEILEYWFSCLQGVSTKRKRELLEFGVSIEEIYQMKDIKKNPFFCFKEREIYWVEKSKKEWDFQKECEKAKMKKINLCLFNSQAFPEKLNRIQSPPFSLFFKGELPREDVLSVAIVGARRCSKYGELASYLFGEELGRNGIQIISGLAAGVDAIAQRGTLNGGGKSYGVLGCGVDICYPRENQGLYQSLEENGGVISEFAVGTAPVAKNFPIRNRIISGLSDVTIIIEAKEKSGSLITADFAMEQGRDVYALPGAFDSELSKGCHRLIKQGAGVLLSPEDFMEDMRIICANKVKKTEREKIKLETNEKLVYSFLDLQPKNVETILAQSNLLLQDVINGLIALEMKGYAKEVAKNYYIKNERL